MQQSHGTFSLGALNVPQPPLPGENEDEERRVGLWFKIIKLLFMWLRLRYSAEHAGNRKSDKKAGSIHPNPIYSTLRPSHLISEPMSIAILISNH